MKVCVVGAGFVGLTTGLVFAEHGHDVRVVEVMDSRLRQLEQGKVPFHEPGVQDAVTRQIAQSRLRFTSDIREAIDGAECTFLCVGTPQGDDGAIDLRFIKQAAKEIGDALSAKERRHVVVVKSTVVPGTAADVVRPIVQESSGWNVPVASNPEFLKEGSALKDARAPDRIVMGIDSGGEYVWDLYASFECPKLTVTTRTAEMIKYAANSFLAVKIAFANEMANLCEDVGIDWLDVVEGIGLDYRINPSFFQAGLGFGGSCFPKDVAALAYLANSHKHPSGVLNAALASNATQPLRAIELLEDELGDLEEKTIALLGLAFKADTDDVRETRALPILHALQAKGAIVRCHDPQACETFLELMPDANVITDLDSAIKNADALVIQTDWQEYKTMDPAHLKAQMAGNTIIDGRRALSPELFADAGLNYRGIGYGANESTD